MLERIFQDYQQAVYDTDRDRALAIIRQAVAEGVAPEAVVFQVVIPSIEIMMKAASEDFEASLAQHFMTTQIASQATDEMVALFQSPPEIAGRIVLGTASGDMHSLGKRIVAGCLRSLMVEVIDLGVNVPAQRFVEAAVSHEAPVIGISAMMVHTARGEHGAREVRRLLREQGLEQKIRIIVGGAPYRFDPELYQVVGADGWAPDGLTAAHAILAMLREARP